MSADLWEPTGQFDPTARLDRTARLVSLWGSPPILGTLYFLLLGFAGGHRVYMADFLTWALMLFLPTLLLLAKMRRGSISSVDMSDLSERRRFLPTSLLIAAATLYAALRLGFPVSLQVSIATTVLWLFASAALSHVWRVSLHVSGVVGILSLSIALFGAPALSLIWLPPVVAWSRLRLHRHDAWQVAGGAILGTACAIAPVLILLH